jgi:hypothetical protein
VYAAFRVFWKLTVWAIFQDIDKYCSEINLTQVIKYNGRKYADPDDSLLIAKLKMIS